MEVIHFGIHRRDGLRYISGDMAFLDPSITVKDRLL